MFQNLENTQCNPCLKTKFTGIFSQSFKLIETKHFVATLITIKYVQPNTI